MDHAFVGKVDEKGFHIKGFVSYRGSFLPAVRGRFRPGRDGTDIELRMRPHREVLLFLAIWLGFLLLSAFVIHLSASGIRRFILLLIPSGLAAFSWVLSSLVFDSDCRWALGEIEAVLQATTGARPAAPDEEQEHGGTSWAPAVKRGGE